jgi:hypothetical protein
MGQDLLQMINAGFNPLQQISKTTGESMLELKKRMEAGAISTDEVRQAFVDATSEGGMFNGMTERLAGTMGGKLNIALSELEQIAVRLGQALAPLVIALTDGFQEGKSVLDGVVTVVEKIATGLGYILAIAKDVINSLRQMELDTTATDKFLDDMEQRDRERAAAERDRGNMAFQAKKKEADAAMQAEKQAAAEMQKNRQKAMQEQQKMMMEQWKQQQKNIERERAARLKAIEDARKAQQRAREQAEENFNRELENARRDAMAFFEQEKQKRDQRREEIARGPGMGMEAGSAEAVRFAADAINASIAKTAVPEEPVRLDRKSVV